MKKIFFVFFFAAVITGGNAWAQSGLDIASIKEKGDGVIERAVRYIGSFNLYEKVQETMRADKKHETVMIPVQDKVTFFLIDLILSFICLWVAVGLYTMEFALNKKYLWFFLAFNVISLFLVLGFGVLWQMLAYLVIKFQPELSEGIQGTLCISMIIAAGGLFIWLVARTFNQRFAGASTIFFVSHLLYLAVIGIFFLIVTVDKDSLLWRAQSYFGMQSILQQYAHDMNGLVNYQSVIEFLKLKAFHI